MSKATVIILDPDGLVVAALEGTEAIVYEGYEVISGKSDDYHFRDKDGDGKIRLVDARTGKIIRGSREDAETV